MQILVVLPSLLDALGGIQTYSQSLVKCLDEMAGQNGSSIKVLALNDNPSGTARGGFDPRHTRYFAFGRNKLSFTLQSIRFAVSSDVIVMAHVNFAGLVPIFRLVNSMVSVRVVVHGIEVWKKLSRITDWGLSRADQIWHVSDYTRRELLAHNPTQGGAARFVHMPNTLGPDYPLCAPALMTRRHANLPDGPMILCVSRMNSQEPYKNVELIIRSLPEVLTQVPQAFLALVGPGDDVQRLKKVAGDLGIQDKVFFLGLVQDEQLPWFYQQSELFVLPSIMEGFGIVFLEAMYYGKACIGARSGGVPEVIEDGVTGMLTEPGAVQDLAKAMIRLLKDDALREKMGKAGRERLKLRFSLESFRQRLKGVLRESIQLDSSAG